MAKLLVDHGADLAAADRFGFTAFHTAADQGYPALVEMLLDRGAAIDLRENLGFTALHLAAQANFAGRQDYIEIVRILLDRGLDPNGRIRLLSPRGIPPDWSRGYTSIFAAQAGEEGSGERAAAES